MNVYDLDCKIRLSAAFIDAVNDTPADPTSVTLYVKTPDGSVTTYTYPDDVSKDSVGNYHYDFSTSQIGKHYYRYKGTGAVEFAGEVEFRVEKSQVVTS